VLVADNAAGTPPAGLGGTDATVTIPSVRITQADGAALRTASALPRSRNSSGLIGTLKVNMEQRQGTDVAGRALMYSPSPYQSGSSVSHYDTTAYPNQLMEPAINGDLTHSVKLPQDLTLSLLKDIGWPVAPGN